MANFLARLFGTKNTRELKRMGRLVQRINELEQQFDPQTDLVAHTAALKERLAAGETLDDLLPEAFAAVREAAKRTKDMRHFDVQLIGGITLHEGRIAEMRTGEGKTLMATLPAYLNALPGKGVHVVTVNDYLARRDAQWMAPIYEMLGLQVGIIQSGQPASEKIKAYQADVVYGTNNEFGFDYLRSNMAFTAEDRLQGELFFAIIDEVDSILIDEARTPLIISGASEENTSLYQTINRIPPQLKEQPFDDTPRVFGEPDVEPTGDFMVDEKNRQVELTELGHQKVEDALISLNLLQPGDSLYSSANLGLLHHVHAALKAHKLYKRDDQYMITAGEVVIVDEHTGRAMPGRRWSDGIHQAVEAKEGLAIQNESQTLASTTFQNYFRLYNKLSGMTGTADTEAFEFKQIYGLDVVVVPTHRPMVRDDRNDLMYLTLAEKYDAIVEDIVGCIDRGQPVLVGTASIESSELLSAELNRRNIKHNVLNAKQHEREADVIADAGRPGTVTIATNMAGRGTDIVLGGSLEAELAKNPEASAATVTKVKADWQQRHDAVLEAGGLHIIGTERHESRRIDNQLRGRSGRQGDPGSSRFFLSLDDNLMRIFVSESIRNMMHKLNAESGEAIEHKMINRSIENAQRKVEGHNFDIRKNLLEYDDVSNDQRQVIYQQRRELMDSQDISETIEGLREEVVYDLVAQHIPPQSLIEQWDIGGLELSLQNEFAAAKPLVVGWKKMKLLMKKQLRVYLARSRKSMERRKAVGRKPVLICDWSKNRSCCKYWISDGKSISRPWTSCDRAYIRAYAQKQPKQEFKRSLSSSFRICCKTSSSTLSACFHVCKLKIPKRLKPGTTASRRGRTENELSAQPIERRSDSGCCSAQEAPRRKPLCVKSVKWAAMNPVLTFGKKYKQCHGQL